MGIFLSTTVQPLGLYRRCHNLTRITATLRLTFFALGTTAFFIIIGHLPFSDLDPFDDDGEIQRWFKDGDLPSRGQHPGVSMVHNYWERAYSSAQEMVQDLEGLQVER